MRSTCIFALPCSSLISLLHIWISPIASLTVSDLLIPTLRERLTRNNRRTAKRRIGFDGFHKSRERSSLIRVRIQGRGQLFLALHSCTGEIS
ncbi:uncharacterized protein BKA55DRAFT_563727 [Fusarium redolens]|uniref:Uncharacterized protein n=1 Tax=Fusarium redolens TaxID=48865 RepID=A0A9P9HCU5_FUSRE|nr:uncharacterized protein BKA55DRAFT_563727 [Fusarium redolens]KAH7255280.1 hypothetical protein BKA55DRAFT_563727 [Fusarium redolens]